MLNIELIKMIRKVYNTYKLKIIQMGARTYYGQTKKTIHRTNIKM